jgi:hypothetical protein
VDLHSWWSGISPALAVVVFFTLAMFVVAVGFLVAAGRLRRANRRKAELWGALEAEFGELVDRIAGGAAPASSLHSRVGRGERIVLLDYLYKSAVQETRPERRSLYASLAQPYLPLLSERARTGDTWQRARAIRTLAELAGRASSPVVLEALDDPAPHVATTAARVYAQLELGPVDALLDRMDRYSNWDRRLLRSVLVSFGLPAAPALRERFADESLAPQLRAVCADALAELDYRAAGETALHVLRRERDVDLVAATLRLLRPPATEPQREMVRRLCEVEDDVVRGQAVACLARIGAPSDLALVEVAAGDLSPWVARSARRGLAERAGGGGPDDVTGAPPADALPPTDGEG